MTVYQAPKPQYTNWQWFKFIGLRTVFPPVLLWDLLKIGVNKLAGKAIGSLVLPAQDMDLSGYEIEDASDLNTDQISYEQHQVITHDGAVLDTLEITPESQKQIEPQFQKYIINLVGNGMCYEDILEEMREDALALDAKIVGFNLRGVGQSSKRALSKDDLVTDGIAQVQRLLDQGVPAQNITLKAHSLGAGIGSLVAQHFHQLGQPINIFNSRSFSNLTNFLVGHARLEKNVFGEAIGQKETFGGKVLGWLIKPIVKLALILANWEIDAISAFKSIPNHYKEYIVVRSRKDIRQNRIDDPVIPHYASIHEGLSSERHAEKAKIDRLISAADKNDPGAIDELTTARKKAGSDRKMEASYSRSDGHNTQLYLLKNREGKSAQTFFREFVAKANEDHAVKPTTNLSH
ncbi:substrate of the Dot/Icm system [Legionella moravica]|uniref:SidB n=1 Tax=Legionella moravica TaxID=39962 RepID=A0A378K746_9GAMM|nr:alpha/beta fold hydrolase [Legionella moravica]KTD31069.1 substrate of the Dot/Icm system [Legionella moravica]STX63651.1 SidB [Legionella moravica]